MMSNDKGKEKAALNNSSIPLETTAEPCSQPTQQAAAPTFVEKFAKSARELSKHAFHASHHDVNDTFIAVVSSGNKSQHASSLSLRDRGESSTAATAREGNRSDLETPTLKTSVPKEQVENLQREFSAFLDGTETLSPPEDVDIVPETLASQAAWTESQSRNIQLPPRTIGEQEARDGEDVLSILAFSPTTYDNIYGSFVDDYANLEVGLTDVELAQLRVVAQELSSISTRNNDSALDQPRNLQMPQDIMTQTCLMGHSTSSSHQQWMQQWEGVLTKYTDEVWGNLLPLVEEARKEVENPSKTKNGSSRALIRLQALLRHIQN